MIDTTQYQAIGQYVLVEAFQEPTDTILRTVDAKQSILEGTVLSCDCFYDEDQSMIVNYTKGDRIIFNQMKSLKIPTNLHEEIFLVRDEDIFAVLDVQSTTETRSEY
jgi:co-chaperonin GroES (HSP10)